VSPHVGDYKAAYDVFFNPGNQCEVMVWDNYNQTPADSRWRLALHRVGRLDGRRRVRRLPERNATIEPHWLPTNAALEQI